MIFAWAFVKVFPSSVVCVKLFAGCGDYSRDNIVLIIVIIIVLSIVSDVCVNLSLCAHLCIGVKMFVLMCVS